MARHHRTDDGTEFEKAVSTIDRYEYDVTEAHTLPHFHEERHDDKYLPDGWKPEYTNRIGADGGIQYPKRVVLEGGQVEFTYEDIFGDRTETGEVFECEYDDGHVTRACVRVHYSDAHGATDVEGFDVVHVIDLTDTVPTHVTCWLNRKEDNGNRDGNTGA